MVDVKALLERLEAAVTARQALGEYNDNARAITELYSYVLDLARIVGAREGLVSPFLRGVLESLSDAPLPTVNERDKPTKTKR